jgi:hypothetical protein
LAAVELFIYVHHLIIIFLYLISADLYQRKLLSFFLSHLHSHHFFSPILVFKIFITIIMIPESLSLFLLPTPKYVYIYGNTNIGVSRQTTIDHHHHHLLPFTEIHSQPAEKASLPESSTDQQQRSTPHPHRRKKVL